MAEIIEIGLSDNNKPSNLTVTDNNNCLSFYQQDIVMVFIRLLF